MNTVYCLLSLFYILGIYWLTYLYVWLSPDTHFFIYSNHEIYSVLRYQVVTVFFLIYGWDSLWSVLLASYFGIALIWLTLEGVYFFIYFKEWLKYYIQYLQLQIFSQGLKYIITCSWILRFLMKDWWCFVELSFVNMLYFSLGVQNILSLFSLGILSVKF